MKDIIEDLASAISGDNNPWDATLYSRAIAEVARLRNELTTWRGLAIDLCYSGKCHASEECDIEPSLKDTCTWTIAQRRVKEQRAIEMSQEGIL